MELCDAGTGGISMLETDPDGRVFFRWEALAGQLDSHAGGATPREWSPCGECLRAGTAMLYSYPGRFFTYFEDAHANIVEGLVIPMYADGLSTGTIWIVSHDAERKFDAEDVRVMTSLGILSLRRCGCRCSLRVWNAKWYGANWCGAWRTAMLTRLRR